MPSTPPSRAGASYADARGVFRRSQSVATKNGNVEAVNDVESEGIGVRVLVDGAWGFAGDRRLTDEGARDAARRACAFARAAGGGDRTLAPLEPQSGSFKTTVEIDPFSVPLGDKIDFCLEAESALARPEVKVAEAYVRAQLERKVLVTSEGSEIEQEIVECGGGIDATAVADDVTQIRSYPSAYGGISAQAGWEYVVGLGLAREAPRVGEQAAALLGAPECPAGVMDVVIDAEQVALQLHESVGHPTELDRVLGFEAAYAGTSFLQPDDCGSLRYGSEHMNVTADPTTPGGLGTFAFDDEGVAGAAAADRARGRARRLARLARGRLPRLDARRRLEPDAARPHDEPPPRAGRGIARGADRRRREGPLPRDEQELVDRRQAAELPVRHAGRVGDRRRQARPDVPRRDVHGDHAAVLGLDGRRRRPRRMAAARADELRQGTAGPGRARLARHVRRPVSAAFRSEFAA